MVEEENKEKTEIKEEKKEDLDKKTTQKENNKDNSTKAKDKKGTEEVMEKGTESPEERKRLERKKGNFDKTGWNPKTSLGKKIKNGDIKDIEVLLDKGYKILEPEIVDTLIPELETELLLIGQSKGKFGGGQRRVFKQTQKKTREGNKPKFATYGLVGNKNGIVGIGYGKSKETVPAREKAIRSAKLNIIKIRRGCGSWECGCREPHTIPFMVKGKCGSVKIELFPAPKGTGLVAEKECQKILEMAGVKDIWSKSFGKTTSKINMVNACIEALKKLMSSKIRPEQIEKIGIIEGALKQKVE